MGDQLFDLFGDILTKPTNVMRQPLFNDENRGTIGLTGPIKPNEPVKKTGETIKKSFLSNTGLDLPSTVAQNTFTPFWSMIHQKTFSPEIYHDEEEERLLAELEFNYPKDTNKIINTDSIDCLFTQTPSCERSVDPPGIQKPDTLEPLPEFDAYEDDFFLDNILDISAPFQDDDLPDLFYKWYLPEQICRLASRH